MFFKWKSDIGIWWLRWHVQLLSWGHSHCHGLLPPMGRVWINIFIKFGCFIIGSAALAWACIPPLHSFRRIVVWKPVSAQEVIGDSQGAWVELVGVLLPVRRLTCAFRILRCCEVLFVGFECLVWLSIFRLIFHIFWAIILIFRDGWNILLRITYFKGFLFQNQF